MMNKSKLVDIWEWEESVAHIHGWDFSHIEGRYLEETDLPWDYKKIVLEQLNPQMEILDIDTGGGEFLLSLGHPFENTSATETYLPNVELCKETLVPLGIDFKEADGNSTLPFEDEKFDMVINRHGAYNEEELYRVLKDGGLFITEQVGAENDRELVKLLLPDETKLPFPEQYLEIAIAKLKRIGFQILVQEECFRPIIFYDVGALVWFARIIEWEFPGFEVEKCLDNLFDAQGIVDEKGCIEGKIHRYLIVAQKR